jgi:acyl carrier protein
MAPSPQQRTETKDPNTAVLNIVREMAPSGVTDLRPDTDLVAELGFDSLGLVELLVELEETLDLPPLDAEVLGGMERISDLERVVSEAQARMPPG